MSFRSFPTSMVQGALIVPQSGQPTNFFYKFLLALFNSAGGGDGIVPVVSGALTAEGNSQQTALVLAADWNLVETVPAGSGVVMPALSPGNDITVWNASGSNLNVYPFAGAAINAGAANAAYVLAPGDLAYFQCWSTTQLIVTYQTAIP
jgi:hypothetical protein